MGCDDAEFGGGDRGDGRAVRSLEGTTSDGPNDNNPTTQWTNERNGSKTLLLNSRRNNFQQACPLPPSCRLSGFSSPDAKLSTRPVSTDHHHRLSHSWPASSHGRSYAPSRTNTVEQRSERRCLSRQDGVIVIDGSLSRARSALQPRAPRSAGSHEPTALLRARPT